MSYHNPTLHHERTIDGIIRSIGGEKRLFRKNMEEVFASEFLNSLENSSRELLDEEKLDMAKMYIENIEILSHDMRKIVPDSYLTRMNKDGIREVYVFEVTATNRLSYSKICSLQVVSESIEEFIGAYFYVVVVDPTTNGYALLDCDMATYRIDEVSGQQWVDYNSLVLQQGQIENFKKEILCK